MLPIHAALLVSTAPDWAKLSPFRHPAWVVAASVAAAALGTHALLRLQRRYQPATDLVRACAPSQLAYDLDAARVAGAIQAQSHQVIRWPHPVDPTWDVLILSPGPQSHHPGFSQHWPTPPPHIASARCQRLGAYAIYDFRNRCPAGGTSCRDDARPGP